MLSPLCKDFLEKFNSEIDDFKNRVNKFIEENKESKDLYYSIDRMFGKEVEDFKDKYQSIYLRVVNNKTSEILMYDIQCSDIVKEKYDSFLAFIDDINSVILSKENNT